MKTLTTAEIYALLTAINYWLKTWPNEEINKNLQAALRKLLECIAPEDRTQTEQKILDPVKVVTS